MPNKSGLICALRSRLQAVLPPQAFLRRDRGDALFVTNAPAFNPGIGTLPGFRLIPEGKLMRILPEESWLLQAEQSDPYDHLSASLLRFREMPVSEENLLLCVQGLKILDTGSSAPAAEAEAFERALRRRAALALRGAVPGGGLYAAAILNHNIKSMKENEI